MILLLINICQFTISCSYWKFDFRGGWYRPPPSSIVWSVSKYTTHMDSKRLHKFACNFTDPNFWVDNMAWSKPQLSDKKLPDNPLKGINKLTKVTFRLQVTKVHFKIVGSDCSYAHNFLALNRVLIDLIASKSCWKKLDFTCKINCKMKRKSCQKWRWKNATHRNSIGIEIKVTRVRSQIIRRSKNNIRIFLI